LYLDYLEVSHVSREDKVAFEGEESLEVTLPPWDLMCVFHGYSFYRLYDVTAKKVQTMLASDDLNNSAHRASLTFFLKVMEHRGAPRII